MWQMLRPCKQETMITQGDWRCLIIKVFNTLRKTATPVEYVGEGKHNRLQTHGSKLARQSLLSFYVT